MQASRFSFTPTAPRLKESEIGCTARSRHAIWDIHAIGYLCVHTKVKINTRAEKNQILEDKVASVQALLC